MIFVLLATKNKILNLTLKKKQELNFKLRILLSLDLIYLFLI